MNINVTKRNGIMEPLNLEKYHDMVQWTVEGLSGCSISEIELAASPNFFEGIKTTDIHRVTTKATADLISLRTPNYQFAAARSLLMEVRKEVWGSWDPKPLLDTVTKNISLGFYEDILKCYTPEEVKHWGNKIKYDRDLDFTYIGLNTAIDKFMVKSKTNNLILETPQELNMLLSMVIFKNDIKRDTSILDFYNKLSTFEISLPSPFMSGLRTPVKGYASCCLIDSGDKTQSIIAANGAAALMTTWKAGIGLHNGSIRGIGASVKNGTIKHNGVVSILRWHESAVKWASQGSRGGCHFRDTEVEILDGLMIDGVFTKICDVDKSILDNITS